MMLVTIRDEATGKERSARVFGVEPEAIIELLQEAVAKGSGCATCGEALQEPEEEATPEALFATPVSEPDEKPEAELEAESEADEE